MQLVMFFSDSQVVVVDNDLVVNSFQTLEHV
jgi:hypothetical protein